MGKQWITMHVYNHVGHSDNGQRSLQEFISVPKSNVILVLFVYFHKILYCCLALFPIIYFNEI